MAKSYRACHQTRVTETKVNARAVFAGRVTRVCVFLPPAHPSRFSGVEAKTTARAWHIQGDKTSGLPYDVSSSHHSCTGNRLNPASACRGSGSRTQQRQAEPLLASSHAEIKTCGCGDQDHARVHACQYATVPPVTVRIMATARRPFRRSHVCRWPAPAASST